MTGMVPRNDMAHPAAPLTAILSGPVQVVVDRVPTHLSSLSYLADPALALRVGDTVTVPFGAHTKTGVIIGPGDPDKATKAVTAKTGRRCDPADIDLATTFAARYGTPVETVIRRFIPTDAIPPESVADVGPVQLTDPGPALTSMADPVSPSMYLITAPHRDRYQTAASAAARLAERGQVLILCPTTAAVAAVMKQFGSGAARLDHKPSRAAAWAGVAAGTVPIGVGTFAAAWYQARTLAGFVVIDDDHIGHIARSRPASHTRDVAAARAYAHQVPLITVGGCPPAASLAAPTKAVSVGGADAWPARIDLVDRSDRPAGQQAFPTPTKNAVAHTLSRGGTVLVITNTDAVTHRCRHCHQPDPGAEQPCTDRSGHQTRPVGWNPARVIDMFGRRVRAVSWKNVGQAKPADLVVVFDADQLLRTQQLEPLAYTTRRLLTAATKTTPGGRLIIQTGLADCELLKTFSARDLTGCAKLVWAHAHRHQLPPFSELVRIRTGSVYPPNVAGWPGRKAGPKPVGDRQWETLLLYEDREELVVRDLLIRLHRKPGTRIQRH